MSNLVQVDVAPGYYLENQTINVSFDNHVESVAINKDGTPPSISKYICYDTLNPPNPFIAVTEDGAGRVCYDGGFPKLYNSSRPSDAIVAFHSALKIVGTTTPGSSQGEVILEAVLFDEEDRFPAYPNINRMTRVNIVSQGGDTTVSNSHHSAQLDVTYVSQSGTKIKERFNLANSATAVTNTVLGTVVRLAVVVTGTTAGISFTTYIKQLTLVDANDPTNTAIIFGTGSGLDWNQLRYSGSAVDQGLITQCREASSFDMLTPTFKYVLNVFDWIMDPRKTAVGNRRVLILGDSVGNYRVDSGGPSDFYYSLQTLIRHGNWANSTIKTRVAYSGGLLDARLPELNQYAAVFLLSSQVGGTYMTDACQDDLVRYRENGGGIFILTDHGPVLPTIESAVASYKAGTGQFFSMGNKVATRFGAWFSGDYNRVPVNVGFIRQNYGDHPLYKNMLGSDSIYAGGSESRVFVTSSETHPPETVTRSFTTVDGYNVINIMVITKDGELVPVKLEYTIVDYNVEIWLNGQRYSHGQVARVGVAETVRVEFRHVGMDRVMTGNVLLDAVSVGTINKTVGQPLNYTPNRIDRDADGEILHINDDTVITLKFTNPAGLESSIRIDRDLRALTATRDLNYPHYDQVLQSLTNPPTTPPRRLQGTLQVRDTRLDLPKVLDASKSNLAAPYGTYETVFRVGVAVFMSGHQYYGWWHNNGNRQGTCTPELDQGVTVRDINCPTGSRLELQLGYYRSATLPTLPVAIYIDGNGPFYKVRDTTEAEAHRHWYGNGVFDIYTYLQSRLNQVVDFKFVYPKTT